MRAASLGRAMSAEIGDQSDWEQLVHLPSGATAVAPGGEFEFDDVAQLAAHFPDLDAVAAAIDPAGLAEGAEPVGYAVRLHAGGLGQFGAFKSAVVALRGRYSDGRPGSCETARVVMRQGEAGNWGEMAELAMSGSARPPFSVAAAEQALKAAVDQAARASAVVGKLSRIVELQPAVASVVGDLVGAIAYAYRAGRFMREAELAQRFELAVAAAVSAKARAQAGAKDTNSKRVAVATERCAEVRRLAETILQRPAPSGSGFWSRDALSGEIHEVWKQEDVPSARTIAKDLTALGYAKGHLPSVEGTTGV